LRHAPIGVRARRRTISMRNCRPRRRCWSGCGNWRRNSSIKASRRASKADGSALASRDQSSKSKEKQKSVAACTFPARLLLIIVRKNAGRGKWAGPGGRTRRMDFTSGSGAGQQVIDGKRIGQKRRMYPECQRGKLGYSPHLRWAQLLQLVTLKGGNNVFDDLDLRAFVPEKLSPRRICQLRLSSPMEHTASAHWISVFRPAG
jgi:hypothetical protein